MTILLYILIFFASILFPAIGYFFDAKKQRKQKIFKTYEFKMFMYLVILFLFVLSAFFIMYFLRTDLRLPFLLFIISSFIYLRFPIIYLYVIAFVIGISVRTPNLIYAIGGLSVAISLPVILYIKKNTKGKSS